MTDDVAKIAAGLSEAVVKTGRMPIPGYEGRYEIDRAGVVYSIPRSFERTIRNRWQVVRVPGGMLARTFSRKGYAQVTLYNGERPRTYEVHRLVCRVFHGEPKKGMEAAHLDGNPANPSADNLAWVTRSENHRHKRLHGTLLTGESVPNSKLNTAAVLDIFRRAHSGESKRALGREYGVSDRAIRKIAMGELWADQTAAVRAHLKGQDDDR